MTPETPPAPTVTGEDWPSDGSCVRCGAIPRRPANGLCATCEDEETVSSPNAPQAEAVVTEAPLTFEGWLDEIENWSLRWERVCEELEIDTLRNGSRLRIWLKTAWDLGATAALRQHQSAVEALRLSNKMHSAFLKGEQELTQQHQQAAIAAEARATKAEAENERLSDDFKTSQLQLLDALARASKAEAHVERLQEFIEEIHKRTPLGQWIHVQHHPNGDWSVAESDEVKDAIPRPPSTGCAGMSEPIHAAASHSPLTIPRFVGQGGAA